MNHPTSTLILNRKNMEWLNRKLISDICQKHNIQFSIICNDAKENFVKKYWVHKEDIIITMDGLVKTADQKIVNEAVKKSFNRLLDFWNLQRANKTSHS